MKKFLWILGCFMVLELPAQSYLLIRGAKVADIEKEQWLNTDVLIADDRVVEMGKNLSIPGNVSAKVLDAKGKYLVPGLNDAHIHFFQSGGLYTRPDGLNLSAVKPYEEEMAWVKQHAGEQMKRYLACGVTGVVDCGGPYWNFEVRSEALKSRMTPHVAVAGPLISTYQPPNLDKADPPIIKVNSPEAAVALVEKQIPYKPDFIKVWYIVQKGEKAEVHLPILRAVKAACVKHGFRLAVHATELETARLAVQEGADMLVHSVFDAPVDDAFIQLLKSKKVIYIPTLSVKEGYEEAFGNKTELNSLEHQWSDPEVVKSLFEITEVPDSLYNARVRKLLADTLPPVMPLIAMQNLKKLSDAGVTIATGTDAGNIGTLHGPAILRELEMMHASGLTNWQLIRASTLGAAAMGAFDKSGKIAKGYRADLLLLKSNPSQDYQNLFDWDTLILKGTLIDRDSILTESHEDLVQRQVNAYNARDIDAFMACFSADCEIYEFETGKLLMKGEAAMRDRYGKMFKELKTLHCKIENRILIGNKVLDKELVISLASFPVHAVAVYEIKNGRIVKCWFIRG